MASTFRYTYRTLIVAWTSLCVVSSILATDYYVATNGSNSNLGTLESPWLTIQYGVGQLSAGDHLYIRGGTYFEKININVSGNSSSRITIRNYQGETVRVDGSTDITTTAILTINNQSYLTIEGLHFTNNKMIDAQGILIEGAGDGLYLYNNKVSEINFSSNPNAVVTEQTNAQGIIVYGRNGSDAITDLRINYNEVFDCILGYSEAFAINGNVDGWEVIGNLVHDNTNIGIDIIGHEGEAPANDQARNGIVKDNTVYNCLATYATSGGIYVDGGRDIVIENNTSYNNGYGIEIGCENQDKTTSNITVRNNIVYNNEVAGLSLGGFDYPTTGKVVDCTVTGNTFYQNDFSDSFTGELFLSYSENCAIHSNIFYIDDLNTFANAENAQPGLMFDYNNIYLDKGATYFEVSWNGTFYFGYANYIANTNYNTNSTFGDPTFVNASLQNPDFHLQLGSAAIDKGDPSYSSSLNEVDQDGHGRIISNIIDCGADESGSSTLCVNNYAGANQLTGPLGLDKTYHASGVLESSQRISKNSFVEYLGAVSIDIYAGHEVSVGSTLLCYINDCN